MAGQFTWFDLSSTDNAASVRFYTQLMGWGTESWGGGDYTMFKGPSGKTFGGVDVRVARRLFMTFDVRYRWAAADLNQQWINFDPIDLSGLGVSAGINITNRLSRIARS